MCDDDRRNKNRQINTSELKRSRSRMSLLNSTRLYCQKLRFKWWVKLAETEYNVLRRRSDEPWAIVVLSMCLDPPRGLSSSLARRAGTHNRRRTDASNCVGEEDRRGPWDFILVLLYSDIFREVLRASPGRVLVTLPLPCLLAAPFDSSSNPILWRSCFCEEMKVASGSLHSRHFALSE